MAENKKNESGRAKALEISSQKGFKLPKLVNASEQTVPATSDFSEFCNPSKDAKILDKAHSRITRCKSAVPPETPRYKQHRYSLTDESSFSFAFPRGPGSTVDSYEEPFGGARALKPATNDEREWNKFPMEKPSHEDNEFPESDKASTDKQTAPATSEFEYRKMSRNRRRVLDKAQPPRLRHPRCKSAILLETPRYIEHRHSLTDGPLSLSFANPGGQDSTTDSFVEPFDRARACEKKWYEIQVLVANFKSNESTFIEEMQKRLGFVRKMYDKKLRDLKEKNTELEQQIEENDRSLFNLQEDLQESKSETASALSRSDMLDKEISSLKAKLAKRERECYLLRNDIRKKESEKIATMKKLSKRRVAEINLENLDRVLDLFQALKREDQPQSEQEEIKKQILMAIKRMQGVKLDQLWVSQTM